MLKKKMDIVDKSFKEEQNYIAENLNRVRKKTYSKLSPVGYCHNCFEELDSPRLFCDDKCAAQYEIFKKINPK